MAAREASLKLGGSCGIRERNPVRELVTASGCKEVKPKLKDTHTIEEFVLFDFFPVK